MYKIQIKKVLNFNSKLVGFLLDVGFEGETAIIGCSRRDEYGLSDYPIRELLFQGECFWLIEKYKSLHDFYCSNQHGEIRFSIWSDDKFTTRLADTEWQPYNVDNESLRNKIDDIKETDKKWLLSYNENVWKLLK
ncbi:MAG TPA: hypothetical protein VIL99_14740 [Ignavibacteria bacterium]